MGGLQLLQLAKGRGAGAFTAWTLRIRSFLGKMIGRRISPALLHLTFTSEGLQALAMRHFSDL